MAETRIDVQLIDEIALPYEIGADHFLDAALRPWWDELVAAFPGLRLDPMFFSVDLMALINMLDMARMVGEEPPNLLNWFEIPCDEELIEMILPLVQALPFVVWAGARQQNYLTSFISHGTNPENHSAHHLEKGTLGVDAIYAWRVAGGTGAGVRFVDVEHAWNLAHEDLAPASITAASVYPGNFGTNEPKFASHGTAVLGIVLGRDNGLGMVGVAPEAGGQLVTAIRADGRENLADAIIAAAIAAQPGGVVLVELGYGYHDPSVGDILVEVSPPVQAAMRAVAAFGITVIEGAGNGGVDLDYVDSYKYGESRAIVVGGAYMRSSADDIYWTRSPPSPSGPQSSYGQRVDCFGPFVDIHAPSGASFDGYRKFTGTSGASAIIAGVACAMQGMAMASSWRTPFWPSEIRRALKDPNLGTVIPQSEPGSVGAMPDLRKIARYYNLPAILPVGAAALPDQTLVLAGLDGEEHILRREWSAGSRPSALPGQFAGPTTHLELQTPAIATTTRATDEGSTTFVDIAAIDLVGGLHHQGWDGPVPIGDFNDQVLPRTTFARGHDLAVGRSMADEVVVAGISPEGRLIATSAYSSLEGSSGFSLPADLASGLTFRRTHGPILFFREVTVPTLSDRPEVVAIDDDGHFHWALGEQPIGSDYVWFQFDASPIGVFEPGAKPAVVTIARGAAFAAIGEDGCLHTGVLSWDINEIGPLSTSIQFSRRGPVGLVRTDANVIIAAAVSEAGLIYCSMRTLTADGAWTSLIPIDTQQTVSPLGGVTVVTSGTLLSILAIRQDGRPCRYDFVNGTAWKSYG